MIALVIIVWGLLAVILGLALCALLDSLGWTNDRSHWRKEE